MLPASIQCWGEGCTSSEEGGTPEPSWGLPERWAGAGAQRVILILLAFLTSKGLAWGRAVEGSTYATMWHKVPPNISPIPMKFTIH